MENADSFSQNEAYPRPTTANNSINFILLWKDIVKMGFASWLFCELIEFIANVDF